MSTLRNSPSTVHGAALLGGILAAPHRMVERVVTGSGGNFAAVDRAQVHRDGAWHWCVHLLATNGHRVYLQRRAEDRPRNPNRWTSTVSGHITAEDATDQQKLIANQHAALVALTHEVLEELRVKWDVHRDARYLGDVDVTSSGGGETCNCHTMVFLIEVGEFNFEPTGEVAEVVAFNVDDVARALRARRGLPAADGDEHEFADNFAPVFDRFMSPEAGRERTDMSGA